jgi:hypothetical protein
MDRLYKGTVLLLLVLIYIGSHTPAPVQCETKGPEYSAKNIPENFEGRTNEDN